MLQWFSSLRLIEQIFIYIAAPASLLLVIQTVMLFFGGSDDDFDSDVSGLDHDGIDAHDLHGVQHLHDFHGAHHIHDGHAHDAHSHDDTDGHGDDGHGTDAGLRFVTLRGIVALLTVFGWTGFCCVQAGVSDVPSVTLAAVLGLGALIGVAYLVRAMMGLQSFASVDYREALGQNASVYLTIPAGGKGTGKVMLTINGSLRECEAVTPDDEPIKTGEIVRVTDLVDESVMVVEREG